MAPTIRTTLTPLRHPGGRSSAIRVESSSVLREEGLSVLHPGENWFPRMVLNEFKRRDARPVRPHFQVDSHLVGGRTGRASLRWCGGLARRVRGGTGGVGAVEEVEAVLVAALNMACY